MTDIDYVSPVSTGTRALRACVTSGFGLRAGKHHAGVDFGRSRVADDSIFAVRGGTVVASHRGAVGTGRGYGELVVIAHGADAGCTLYAHLSRRLVAVGDSVTQGQIIGVMGDTDTPGFVHLHFGYYRAWPAVAPFSEAHNPASNPALILPVTDNGN